MFISPTKGKRSLSELTKDIVNFITSDPQSTYRLIIGSDSHARKYQGQAGLRLVSAILIHRVGFGGKYFWQSQQIKKTHTIRDKIYAETQLSLDTAKKVLPKINQKLNGHGNYELEIHIDVGRSGPTRDMIKEVVGMVNGNGYTAKTKPGSYGASKVADKHT